MKGFICCVLTLFCFSCATVKTLDPPLNHVEIAYKGKESYCKNIPRIYSGISYNACLFYGEPSTETNIDAINNVPVVLIDSAFSLITDTVVLPYTIITQVNKGDIRVN